MISLEKLPKNGGDLDKLIVAKGFKKLPKVQKIARSGHTGCNEEKIADEYDSRVVAFDHNSWL